MDRLKEQILKITNPALQLEFIPCDRCAGILSPRHEHSDSELCGGCLHNKAAIEQLQRDIGVPFDKAEELIRLSPTERQYLSNVRSVNKYLGNLAKVSSRGVMLECRSCAVSFRGCASVCCCPECGDDLSEQLQPSLP